MYRIQGETKESKEMAGIVHKSINAIAKARKIPYADAKKIFEELRSVN